MKEPLVVFLRRKIKQAICMHKEVDVTHGACAYQRFEMYECTKCGRSWCKEI